MTTLERFGNFVKVTPDHQELLGPALTYQRRIQDGPDPRNIKYVKVQSFVCEKGYLVAPFGFTARIVNLLRGRNIPIEFVDSRAKHLPEPCFDRLDALREGQDELIAAIVANECGIIEAPAGSGKSFVVKQLCKMWPTANIIVACYSRDIIRQIRGDLLEMFPEDEVGLVGGGGHYQGRITCCVDRSLTKCDLDKCDILLYDEVHRAGSPTTAAALASIPECRMYGFSASPKGRGDNSDLEVEGLFGKIIYKATYQEAQRVGSVVPIEVYCFSCESLPPVQAPLTTLQLERQFIWRSDARNRLIARAVRWSQAEFGADSQILISVKTVDHAVHLGQYLPDFKLVYAGMNPRDRVRWIKNGLISGEEHPITTKEREALRDDFRAGKVRRAIATGVWSTGVDFPGLSVLVRADAQASTIASVQIPGRVTRSTTGKNVGVVLDFDDVFGEALNRRWQARQRIYRKRDWRVVPVTRDKLRSVNI